MKVEDRPDAGDERACDDAGAAALVGAAGAASGAQAASDRSDAGGAARFYHLLRAWVIEHHDLPGSRAEQVERTHLLLYAMTSAATLGEAAAILARFRRLVWGDRGLRVEEADGGVALVLEQDRRPGVAGLLGELWSLSFLLAELEFLAGGRIEGVEGEVRAPAGRAGAPARRGDRPLAYGREALALRLPAAALGRRVVARGREVETFLRRLLPRAFDRHAPPPPLADLVAAIVRADRLQEGGLNPTLDAVSGQLGCSPATLRRRLAAEGTCFSTLRERAEDALARLWLDEGARVETVAERLGYSDAFAFRRAFRRRHGLAPTAYRRRTAPPDAPTIMSEPSIDAADNSS